MKFPSCAVQLFHFHPWNSISLISPSCSCIATQAPRVPFFLRCDLVPASNFRAFISFVSHATLLHKRHVLSFCLIPVLWLSSPSPSPRPCRRLSSSKHIFIFNISPNVIPFPSVLLVLLCFPIVPILPLTLRCSSHEAFLRFPLDCPLRNPLPSAGELVDKTQCDHVTCSLSSFFLSVPCSLSFFPYSLPSPTPQSTQAQGASWKNCLSLLERKKNTPVRGCPGNSSR